MANVNKVYEDLQVLQAISNVMNENASPMMGMGVDNEIVSPHIDTIRTEIKKACKTLVQGLTEEQVNKIDIGQLVKMFGEDYKKDIVKLISK